MSIDCKVNSLLVLPIVIAAAKDGTIELVGADELSVAGVLPSCCHIEGGGVLRGGTPDDDTKRANPVAGIKQG